MTNRATLGPAALRRVSLLLEVPLFSELDTDALVPVAEVCVERSAEPGEVVVRQGEVGEALFVIESGRVEIVKDWAVVATLGARECLGEMALIDGEARSASAIAREPTRLLAIDRESFEGLVELYPGLSRSVMRVLARRLRAVGEGG